MTVGIAGLWLCGLVLIFTGSYMLRRPESLRRLFLRAAHLMYGERIPRGFWSPAAGGVGFLACGAAAIIIGFITLIHNVA